MSSCDLSHLESLSQIAPHHLADYLCDPFLLSWGSYSIKDFSIGFEKIRSMLTDSPDLLNFLELHLISEFLLFRGKIPEWTALWIEKHIDLRDYFPGITLKAASSGTWTAVPLVLTSHGRCHIRYFVTGFIPGKNASNRLWPLWAGEVMDESTQAAVRSAAAAARGANALAPDEGFFCYPLVAPNRTVQISGTSLGLPIALGFKKLLTGEPAARRILATGRLDDTGRVQKVGHLKDKIAFARREGFDLFIYPEKNHRISAAEEMATLPVADLAEADMLAKFFMPGKANSLLILSEMLKDPRMFINNLEQTDPKWIAWANRQGRLEKVMGKICTSGRFFSDLVDTLDEGLERTPLEVMEMRTSLVTGKLLETAKVAAPFSAFRWCCLNLTLANRRGRVDQAEKWSGAADKLVAHAIQSGRLDAFIKFNNHCFVSRHIRYCFEPGLPDDIKKLVEFMEDSYKLQAGFESAANHTLGCFYGTIAQNYGFCGPEYLADTEKYCALARQAFGEKIVSDYKDDWLRQFNYLVYAYLDADQMDKAENSLFTYLGITDWNDLKPLLPDLSPWQHAVCARFFADTGKRSYTEDYLHLATGLKCDMKPQKHPWQLWLFNMGRIARSLDDAETAAELFSQSLDVCLSEANGPAVHVMALLPLSGLRGLGCLKNIDAVGSEKTVRKAAAKLNPNYFSTLDEKNFPSILKTVRQRPALLFPFSYH